MNEIHVEKDAYEMWNRAGAISKCVILVLRILPTIAVNKLLYLDTFLTTNFLYTILKPTQLYNLRI